MSGRLDETLKSINSKYGTNLDSGTVMSAQKADANRMTGTFGNNSGLGITSRQHEWRQKYQGKGYNSLATTLSDMEDGDEKRWLTSYADRVRKQEWKALVDSKPSDWLRNSDYGLKAYEQDRETASYDRQLQNWIDQMAEDPLRDANPQYYQMVQQYRNDTSYKEMDDRWSEEQRRDFGYLYVQDKKKAEEYAIAVNEQLNAQAKQQQRQAVQEKATSGFLAGLGETGKAIAAGMTGIGDYAQDLAEYQARGRITERGDRLTPKEYSDAVIGGVSEHLNESFGKLDKSGWEKLMDQNANYQRTGTVDDLSDLHEHITHEGDGYGLGEMYGIGVSSATSMASAHALGQAGSLIQFFGSAAASAVDDARNRGASDEQALAYGAALGASESLTELVPIDSLLNIGKASELKGALWSILKQSGEEFLGEGLNSVISSIADHYIMADKSNFQVQKQVYMENGLTEEDAEKKAWKNLLKGIVYDAVTGAASGALSGSATIGIHKGLSRILGNATPAPSNATELANNSTPELSKATDMAGKSTPLPGNATADNPTAVTEKSSSVDDKMSATENATGKEVLQVGQSPKVGVSKMETVQVKPDMESFAQQFGTQAEAVKRNYLEGQDLQEYEVGFQTAYAMGLEGGKVEALGSVPYLIQSQREIAFNLGRDAAAAQKAAETKAATAKATTTKASLGQTAQLVAEDGSNGGTVTIAEIVSIDDSGMTLRLEDGRTVTDEDLDFPEGAEVYSTVMELGMDAESANAIVKASAAASIPRTAVAEEIETAYHYGRYGYGMDALLKARETAGMPESILQESYRAGEKRRQQSRETAQANGNRTDRKADERERKGKVHFRGETDTLNDLQRESLRGLEWIADLTGAQIHVENIGNSKGLSRTNGLYDPADDSIHIDLRAGSDGTGTLLYTVAHEFVHRMRQNNEAAFYRLADFLVEQYGKKGISTDALVKQQMADAAADGVELNYDEAFEEMVADAMEAMFTDTDALAKMEKLKTQDKSLWQEIKDFVLGLAEKIKAAYARLKPDSAEARYVLQMKESIDQIAQLFAEGVMAEGTEPSDRTNTKVKYSFAGRSSATADRSALQQAETLALQGVDNETIRQQTGWYKGMDGKWRYEIDDSQMEISGEIINYMSLGELMQHEKLFAAYPDLADIDVVFQSLDAGVNGSYHPQFDSINLSYKLKNDPIGLRDALVHEIQHAIQHREGFTNGATAASWDRKIKAGFDSRRAADIRKAQETERELSRIQKEEPEFYRDMVELDAMTPDLPRGEIDWETLEKIEDDPVEWQQYDARREELEAKYGDTKVWDMNDLLYQREQAAKNVGRTGVELYFDTAGEIEARDASNRRSKSQEQRKTSPPRLGNEDTVFADGNGPSADYVGKTADGVEVYETSEKTRNLTWAERKKTFLHLMRQQYRGRTAKFIRNGHAYYAKFEYRDVSKNIYGDDKSDPKGRDAKINVGADGNIFELVENSKYSRSEIERGKTQRMHRGVNHWDYFVKTVQIDGTVFDLTANVRKKADGEFVYIIEMMENNEIEPSSPQDSQNSGRNGVPNSSIISISNADGEVKQKFSRRKQTEAERMQIDQQYLAAVDKGDMKTAQKMVDEAAKQWGAFLNNSEANEVFPQTGEVRTFYHGTNTGDFTVFDKGLLGNSSGDLGWFGKGFYFAFSADEARAYGGRVIHAYLKMKNPYDYSQLYKFKGSDRGSSQYARFAWLYNIVKQFPDVVTDQKVYAYPNDAEEGKVVSWKQLVRWMDRIEKDAKFSTAQVELSNGDTAWELRANPKQESFTNADGETFTWTEYGMRQLFATEMDAKEPINQIGAYLVNVMGVEPISRRSIEKIDFSGAVQKAGYDGILQSPSGDEAVVFDPSQIKLSDPVTYDDSGNIIPLSKRFDNNHSDIRYSRRKQSETEALQEQNTKLQEDVTRLKELVKLQGQVTNGKILKPSSVENAAKYLKKLFHTNGDTKELAQKLNGLYEYIASDPELTWDGVKEQAAPIVQWLQDNEKFQRDQYAQETLDTLKGQSFRLDETQLGEVKSQYGSLKAYRMVVKNMASSKSTQSLDQLWQELSDQYPDIFSPDTSASDMPLAFAEAVERLEGMESTETAMDWRMKDQTMLEAVYDSYWRVSGLETVADKYSKKIFEIRGKHYEKMTELRKNRDQKLKELRESKKQSVQTVRDNRDKAAEKKKIRKTIAQLNKLLTHGNKKQNVKKGMEDFAATALASAEILFTDNISNEDMILNGIGTQVDARENRLIEEVRVLLQKRKDLYSLDTATQEVEDIVFTGESKSYAQRMAESEKLDRKISENMRQLKGVFERERNRLNEATVSGILEDLAEAYRGLGSSDALYIRAATDERVYQHLKQLKDTISGTTVRDMSVAQLKAVSDAYTMVLTTIRNANKAFTDGRSIQSEAEQMVAEFRSGKIPEKALGIAAKKIMDSIGWNYEKFHYALDRIGSPTLTNLFGKLADSEDITMRDVQEAKAYQKEMVEKYHYNDWKIDQKIDRDFVDNTGKEFRLTLGELMALYAYSRRDGADRHIEYGGFKLGKAALTDPKPATTYKLSAEQLAKITGMLTEEQRTFAEGMQKYLSETMGAKGNEVSMKLYGIEMFKEENYFPLHIAGEFKAQAQESQAKAAAGFQTMSNAGFTQTRNKESTAPIVLEDFMSVWADHVNEMARYHGAVPALEDIRRVMNYSVYSDADSESVSVEAAMTNAFGKQAVQYFDNLYREANSGAITDKLDAAPKKMLSLFRKNAVAYSVSVWIQQPASIYRARMMVDRKYFGRRGFFTLAGGVLRILNRKKWNAAYEEMMRYAPGVTMAKEIGGFDTSTGSSIRSYLMDTGKSFTQSMKNDTVKNKAKSVLNLVDDNAIANLPNVMDKVAWIEMWEACKREAVAKNPKMETDSDAFMEKVGQRFTEVIRGTQVYDSMFAKSPMLKTNNLFVQSAVSFMNESNTVANMAEAAIRDLTRGNKKQAAKTAEALITSIVVNELLKSIVYAMRDDDEDETLLEKYISAVAGSLIDDVTVFNYVPFARDVWSVWQGYDAERADMAIVSDAVNAVKKLAQLSSENAASMTEDKLVKWNKEVTDASWAVAETLSPLFGIPLKNIRRDILAVFNAVKIRGLDKDRQSTALSIQHTVEEAIWQGSKSSTDRLYEAMAAGDDAYVQRLKAGYETDAAYHSAIKLALRDHDSRIWEAAMAWNNNDLKGYMALAREIIAEGNFIQDDVVLAIRAEASSMEEKQSASSSTINGYFTNEKFGVAMGQNNTYMADIIREDLIDTKIANGKTREEAEESVKSTARSQLRELFETGAITASSAEKMLIKYGGYEKDDAADKVAEWEYEVDHPELNGRITYTQFKRWEADGKTRGISLNTFTEVAEYRDSGTSGSVRSQDDVKQYIESITGNKSTRHALWCCFYKESTSPYK